MADEPPPVRLVSDRTASWEWECIRVRCRAQDTANEGGGALAAS
jgi:hypothetical protein